MAVVLYLVSLCVSDMTLFINSCVSSNDTSGDEGSPY